MRSPLLALVLALACFVGAVSAHAEGWAPGPGAAGDDTFAGVVDQPAPGVATPADASFEVRGWAVDQTAQGWSGIDQVQVYSGLMEAGGSLLSTATLGLDRPDVADALGNPFFAASGYSAIVPSGALPAGAHD